MKEMKLDACLIEVENFLGKKLSQSEQSDIAKRLNGAIEKIRRKDASKSPEAVMMQALESVTEESMADAYQERRYAILNTKKQIENYQKLKTNWFDKVDEGIKVLFGDKPIDEFGSRAGVISFIQSKRNRYQQGLFSKLSDAGVLDIAVTGKMDTDIARAKWELTQENPRAEVLGKLDPDAVKVAEIFHSMQELARLEANAAGARIGQSPGFLFHRTQDHLKIAKAGGKQIGSPENFKAWKNDLETFKIDWERSFPNALPEDRDALLKSLYDQLSNGYHLNFGGEKSAHTGGISSTAKKVSHERVIHFQDADGEFAYHRKYGAGQSMMEGVMGGLSSLGRDVAIMEQFGPGGINNIETIVGNLTEELHKSGRGGEVKGMTDAFNSMKKHVWPTITGEAAVPGNSTVAHALMIARNIISANSLGGALLSSIPDAGMVGSIARYYGDRDVKSTFAGMNNLRKELFNEAKRFGVSNDQRFVAQQMGIMIDHVLPALTGEADSTLTGKSAAFMQHYFKFNGQAAWTRSVRLAAATQTAHYHASNIGKSFDQLSDGMKASFRQFGLVPESWDVIRKGEIFTDYAKRDLLSASSVRELDPKVAGVLPEVKSKIEAINKSEHSIETKEKMRQKAYKEGLKDVADKYTNLISEISQIAASEPGTYERSIMLRGHRPGTLEGELGRSFWQFKSFTVSVMRKHLNRELWGYSAKNDSAGTALKNMITGKGNGSMAGMASMVTISTALGMLANDMSAISNGLKPRSADDPEEMAKIVAAGFTRSGAAGIYADFLFGEMTESRFGTGPLATALGPTAVAANTVFNLIDAAKKGEDAWSQAYRAALKYTPGVGTLNNHLATKAAFNYLVNYHMQEFLNPGALRRQEDRLKKRTEQEYLSIGNFDLTPSRNIQRGGGFK